MALPPGPMNVAHRWAMQSQAVRSSSFSVTLYVAPDSEPRVPQILRDLFSLDGPTPRSVTLLLEDGAEVPEKDVPRFPRAHGLVATVRMGRLTSGEDQIQATLELSDESGAALLLDARHYTPEAYRQICETHERFPRALCLGRAQLLQVGYGRIRPSSINDTGIYLGIRERHDLIPLLSGAMFFPVGARGSLPGAYFDASLRLRLFPSDPEMWLTAALLACSMPEVITCPEAALPLEDTATLMQPDMCGRGLHQLQGAFAAFGGGDLHKLVSHHKGPRGNVLLMAGQEDLNGANISLLFLHKHLAELGENTFFVLPCHGQLEDLLRANALDYAVLGVPPLQWTSGLSFTPAEEQARIDEWEPNLREGTNRLEGFIARNGIELVHENTSGSFMAARAAEELGRHFVWHLREFNEEDHRQRLWASYHPYDFFGRADACICISRSVFDKYRPLVGSDNLHLIYNGISPEAYSVEGHLPFEAADGSVLLSCAGRIFPGKAQLDLVKAFVALAPRHPETRLCLAGSCSDQDYLDKIMGLVEAHGLSGRVQITGVVEDMRSVWAETDIAVVPSRFEAFGRCAVEAMMAGCLVIGNDSGGTAEIVEDGTSGLLYARDSVEALVERADWALRHRGEARALAEAGRERALRRFTSQANARRVFDLHQSILGGDDSGRRVARGRR